MASYSFIIGPRFDVTNQDNKKASALLAANGCYINTCNFK